MEIAIVVICAIILGVSLGIFAGCLNMVKHFQEIKSGQQEIQSSFHAQIKMNRTEHTRDIKHLEKYIESLLENRNDLSLTVYNNTKEAIKDSNLIEKIGNKIKELIKPDKLKVTYKDTDGKTNTKIIRNANTIGASIEGGILTYLDKHGNTVFSIKDELFISSEAVTSDETAGKLGA